MTRKYFVVHFSGHNGSKAAGSRDQEAFQGLAPLLKLGDVSRFAFFTGFGVAKSLAVARQVHGIALGYAGGRDAGITYIIHGYSAGGVTALHFAQLVPDAQIVYIGLSDAAFMRGESDGLMTAPGSRAYHLNENYFQTYENSPSRPEIHDRVTSPGWDNIQISLPLPVLGRTHQRAVAEADGRIFEKMKDIVRNDR